MSNKWFVVRDGKEQGPFTGADLKKLASTGKLRPSDSVRRDDMKTPRPASDIKGLFPAAQPSPTNSSSPEISATKQQERVPRKSLVIAGSVAGALLFLCCGSCGIIGIIGKSLPKPLETPVAKQSEQADEKPSKSPNPKEVATANDDHVVLVDTPLVTIPESVTQNPFQLSPDGNYLLANGWALWNVKTGKKLPSPDHFLASRLSPSGKCLAALQFGNLKTLVIYSIEADRLVVQQKIELGHRQCFGPFWSDDEKRVVVTCGGTVFQGAGKAPREDQHGFIVALGEPKPRVVSFVHPAHFYRVEYPDPIVSPDGKLLAVKFDEPSVCIFETATGIHVKTIPFTQGKRDPNGCHLRGFSSNGSLLITSTSGKEICLWETSSWKNALTFATQESFVEFTDGGLEFVTVTPDQKTLITRAVEDGKEIRRKRLDDGQSFYSVSISKNPWELRLVPKDDGRMEVWQAAQNRLAVVVGKPDGVNRSFRAITPDGRFVASAQREKIGIEIWDTEKGQKTLVKEYKQSLASGARPDYLNIKAPPISDAIYQQIRIGMTTIEVWKLVGGRPYDDKSKLNRTGKMGTDWIAEETEYYHSKDHPGSRIVLEFRGKGTAPPLVKKSIVP